VLVRVAGHALRGAGWRQGRAGGPRAFGDRQDQPRYPGVSGSPPEGLQVAGISVICIRLTATAIKGRGQLLMRPTRPHHEGNYSMRDGNAIYSGKWTSSISSQPGRKHILGLRSVINACIVQSTRAKEQDKL
ncbi:Glycogen phosphorylase, partial [Giardia duodenalis]